MGLDRNCKDMPYLTGRLIAVTEHYASKHFGPGTLGEMFKFPRRYCDVFSRYIDKDDENYQEIGVAPLTSMPTAQEQSQAWVGYYHQKAEYNDEMQKGGFRPGSGRPSNDRSVALSVRITQEAMDILNKRTNNKSEYIDNLIKNAKP